MPASAPSPTIHDPHRRWPALAQHAVGLDARLVDAAERETIVRFAADGMPAPVVALAADEAAAHGALVDGADGALTRADFSAESLRVTVERARIIRRTQHARCARRAAELCAADRTFESFGRAVSHDLRAPLRAIDGFAQALDEDYGADLDPLARRYVQRIRFGAERLGDRLSALLALTEMIRRPFEPRLVDLGEMADAVVEALRERAPERAVRWQRDDGLMVCGDPRLLRQLLRALLENAWVFSGPRPDARIELRRWRGGFVVRDDGVGFGQNYSDKIFQAFARFHTEEEFPGAGIGLAVARCAVERHGGHIVAQGVEGRGAAFAFTLDAEAPLPVLEPHDLLSEEAG